jgi:quercetin dioxygenase-like cupin family protein
MNNKPYITYLSKPLEIQKIDSVLSKCYVNEVGQVSFGTIDYIPGWFIALHHHYTWELIIIDCSSAGPGYTLFNGCWWRAEPGSAVFIPKGFSHAWSSGNDKGFKMLWVYGGSHEEADRLYDVDPQIFQPISQEEERSVFAWKAKATR